jgi:hypothetical protein
MVQSPSIFYEGYYDPAIALSSGTVYLSYSYYNASVPCGCGSPLLGGQYSQWVVQSTDGVHWGPPVLAAFYPGTGGLGLNAYEGYTSSIAFDSNGDVLVAGALATRYDQASGGAIIQGSNVTVATLAQGPSASLTVKVPGLPNGVDWTLAVDGNRYAATQPSLVVPGLPEGQPLLVDPIVPRAAVAPGEYDGTRGSLFETLAGSTTVSFPYVAWAAVTFNIVPSNLPYVSLALTGPNATYASVSESAVDQGILTNSSYGCDVPWYLPVGSQVTVANASSSATPYSLVYLAATGPYASYFNGTGPGSFTGFARTATLNVNGPIDETIWILPRGTYNVTVGTPDLPSSATARFSLDGGTYSLSGGTELVVRNVSTGLYEVTNLSANASAGWRYYGSVVSANPVPVPDTPTVNLSFAYVDLAASPGPVSFHAEGLPATASWSLEFNGTIASSSTAWINLTSRPGRFPITAYPVVGSDGTSAFTPAPASRSVDVSSGGQVTVAYTANYLLTVVAGRGGSVAPSASDRWVPTGSAVTLTAANSTGYAWDGWAGTGTGAYTGSNRTASFRMAGPIVESAAFYPEDPDRFNATVFETGLPVGTTWTVYLGGVGHSSNSTEVRIPDLYSCQFSGNRGRYPFEAAIAYATGAGSLERFVPESPPPTVCGGAGALVDFGTQYFVALGSTEGGMANATANGSLFETGSGWYDANRTLTLEASPGVPATPPWVFLGWTGTGPGSYTGLENPARATPEGPIEEAAEFHVEFVVPPPLEELTLRLASPLEPGTAWSIVLGGETLTSDTDTLVAPELDGSYPVQVEPALSPDGTTRYTGAPSNFYVDVRGNTSATVTFATSYWVDLWTDGPGRVSTASQWAAAESTLNLVASPDPSAVFLGWNGTGNGSYTGALFDPSLHVDGPVAEVATFEYPASAPLAPALSPTVGELAISSVVLLVAGIGAGVLLGRRGRRPRAAAELVPAEPGPTDGGMVPADERPAFSPPEEGG